MPHASFMVNLVGIIQGVARNTYAGSLALGLAPYAQRLSAAPIIQVALWDMDPEGDTHTHGAHDELRAGCNPATRKAQHISLRLIHCPYNIINAICQINTASTSFTAILRQ